MAFSTKSREEIEELKKQWLADGVWDIENTEGFEAHKDELLNFRVDTERARASRAQDKQLGDALKRAQLIRDINDGLGLQNLMLAERLLALQDRLDQQAKLIGLLHGFACEVSSSFSYELKKNDAWASLYDELRGNGARVNYL